MAKIIEFPQKLPLTEPEKDDPNVKALEILTVVERLIGNSQKKVVSETDPTWQDMEALKDIYALFSVQNSETIAMLASASKKGSIDKKEEVLLFAMYKVFEKDAEEIVKKVIEGLATKEMPTVVPEKVKEYLLNISQRINNLEKKNEK